MSISLAEALQAVDLQAGGTYRCQVKNLVVEVRVTAAVPAPSTIPAADIMLAPWTDFPRPSGTSFTQSRLGPLRLPEVPEIPADEGSP